MQVSASSSLGPERNSALDEFAGWMASREGIASVLRAHGYSLADGRSKLIEIYWTLLRGGAGQWVGTTYVPTAALYDPRLLNRLLDIERATEPSYKETVLTMAVTALDYVEAQTNKAKGKRRTR